MNPIGIGCDYIKKAKKGRINAAKTVKHMTDVSLYMRFLQDSLNLAFARQLKAKQNSLKQLKAKQFNTS